MVVRKKVVRTKVFRTKVIRKKWMEKNDILTCIATTNVTII
jgi:hypothetical protein